MVFCKRHWKSVHSSWITEIVECVQCFCKIWWKAPEFQGSADWNDGLKIMRFHYYWLKGKSGSCWKTSHNYFSASRFWVWRVPVNWTKPVIKGSDGKIVWWCSVASKPWRIDSQARPWRNSAISLTSSGAAISPCISRTPVSDSLQRINNGLPICEGLLSSR